MKKLGQYVRCLWSRSLACEKKKPAADVAFRDGVGVPDRAARLIAGGNARKRNACSRTKLSSDPCHIGRTAVSNDE
jgi:hypothetical protein